MRYTIVLALVLSLTLVSFSLAEIPQRPTGFVNDFAGILSVEQRVQLETMLVALERNTTVELAVVTVESAADPFGYSTELFQSWGIGKSANDNGLLVLYAKQQNRIEVRTGYGVEGILPDSKVGRILDDYYVPMRDANRTADGILAATVQLASVISDNADEVRTGRSFATDMNHFAFSILTDIPLMIFLVLIFGSIIAGIRTSKPKCPTCKIRMKVDHADRIPTFMGGYNETVYYKCPKCGRVEKRKRSRSGWIFLAMMGGRGGGGFGGGFGGGGTGGGGAGR